MLFVWIYLTIGTLYGAIVIYIFNNFNLSKDDLSKDVLDKLEETAEKRGVTLDQLLISLEMFKSLSVEEKLIHYAQFVFLWPFTMLGLV